MDPIFAESMLRLALGPVIKDVVSDAAVHGGRNGVGNVRVYVNVTAKVVWSVFELVHSDDSGGQETFVVVVGSAVSVCSRVAADVGDDHVFVLDVGRDYDFSPSSGGFGEVRVVVVVFACDGLGGGDCSYPFASSCVFGCGHV